MLILYVDFFDGLFIFGEHSFLFSIGSEFRSSWSHRRECKLFLTRNGSDCRVTYLSGIDIYTREIGLLIIVASPQLSLPRVSAFIALL